MRKQALGFTLVELLIVIVILTIVLAMAAPAFSDMVATSRFNSAAMQIKADLNQARAESIKRNSRVLICPRNAAGDDCISSSNWAGGWLICTDIDKNGACDASTAAAPNPIVVRGALASSLALSASETDGVPFNSNGTQSAAAAVDLTLTRPTTSLKRIISVATIGNITSK